MILSDSLKLFICILNDGDDHLAQDALINPNCGHRVCSKCIQNLSNNDIPIKCKFCDNQSHVNDFVSESSLNVTLSSHIDELFKYMYDKFRTKIDQLKDSLSCHEENIDLKIEFIRDEIEVRVDSLKTKIDKLHRELVDSLMETRKKFLNEKQEKYQVNLFEDMNLDKTEKNLFKYQSHIQEIDEILRVNMIGDYQLFFDYEFYPDTKSIGQISYKSNCKLVNKLKTNTFNMINLDCEVTDMLYLSNDNLALFSWETGQVILMNKHFQVIDTIDNINGKTFNPMSACTNGMDRLYMGDYYNRQIIMTDLAFNFIKYSNVLSDDLSSYPRGLCFSNNHLYVCDQSTNRIHRFNADLSQHVSFAIDIKPKQIKIKNDIACVSSLSTYVCFYKTQSFELIEKYCGHGGNIFELNGNFYEYSNKQKKFYIYDENGRLIEEFGDLELSKHVNDDSFHGILHHKNHLLLSSGYSKKLIVF